MERTMVSFNFPNLITVTLMGILGYAILGVLAQLLMRQRGMAGG